MGTVLNRVGWNWLLILVIALGMTLAGCGGAEEATEGEPAEEETLGEAQPAVQEQPKNADDQALTSFIGEKEPAKTQQAEPQPSEESSPTGQLARYEKQIETLRTENTTLKQKVLKLEQDNRSLNAMMSESEGRISSANAKADSLEKLLTTQPVVTAQPAAPAQEPAATEPTSNVAITSYEDALRAFNAKRYDDAIAGLTTMLQAGVTKDLEDNCKYWIGESNFAKKRYKDAIKDFEDVLTYKNSEKQGDAQYMIAQCYERTGDKVKAKAGYERVVKEFPLSKVVKKAKERWARL